MEQSYYRAGFGDSLGARTFVETSGLRCSNCADPAPASQPRAALDFTACLVGSLTRLALQVSDADSSNRAEFDLNDEDWRQSFHAIHAQRGSGRRGEVAWLGLRAEAVEAGSPGRV